MRAITKLPSSTASITEIASRFDAETRQAPPSDSLPPGLDPAGGKTKFQFLMSRGARTASNLMAMWTKSSPAHGAGQPSAPAALKTGTGLPDMAAIVREGIGTSHAKFHARHSEINTAMNKWCAGDDELQSLLKPYIQAGVGKQGLKGTDGLRSGVTGLLNGIDKPEANAAPHIKAAAKQLREAVIFTSYSAEGKPEQHTLVNFATLGEHGTRKIDELNISPQQKEKIAARVALALVELDKLGAAYVSGDRFTLSQEFLRDGAPVVDATISNPATLRRTGAISRISRTPKPERTATSTGVTPDGSTASQNTTLEGRRKPLGPRPIPHQPSPSLEKPPQELRRPPSGPRPKPGTPHSATSPEQIIRRPPAAAVTNPGTAQPAPPSDQTGQKVRRPPLKPRSRRGA